MVLACGVPLRLYALLHVAEYLLSCLPPGVLHLHSAHARPSYQQYSIASHHTLTCLPHTPSRVHTHTHTHAHSLIHRLHSTPNSSLRRSSCHTNALNGVRSPRSEPSGYRLYPQPAHSPYYGILLTRFHKVNLHFLSHDLCPNPLRKCAWGIA